MEVIGESEQCPDIGILELESKKSDCVQRWEIVTMDVEGNWQGREGRKCLRAGVS